MNMSDSLRLLAGTMVLITVLLAWLVSIYWLLLGVFVGVNLIQSAFTKSCPAIWMLRKAGVKGRP